MIPYLTYTTPHDADSVLLPLPSTHSDTEKMALLPNMIISVMTNLSPLHQAYIRSAGLKGLLIFNQVAEDGDVPMCAEVVPMCVTKKKNDEASDSCPQLIPLATPPPYAETTQCSLYNSVFLFSPVVVSHSAMEARGLDGLDVLMGYTVPLVRYHCNASVKEVGSLDPSEPYYALAFLDEKTMHINEVQLVGCEGVTTIHHSFLACLSTMVKVDISPLQHVTSIGNYFMYQCDSFGEGNHIDLTPFGNVTTVGEYFLQHCNIDVIDISPMKSLTSIGTGFLSGCHLPKEICTSSLSNIQSIPSDFLLGCKGLLSIDTTPFQNVTTIGVFFLGECPLLTTINLEPFKNVTTIGMKFLFRCSGLKSIDVSLLKGATSVGKYFLKGCTTLHQGSREMYSTVTVEELPDDVDHNNTGRTAGGAAGGTTGGGSSSQMSLKQAVLVWRNDEVVASEDQDATNSMSSSSSSSASW